MYAIRNMIGGQVEHGDQLVHPGGQNILERLINLFGFRLMPPWMGPRILRKLIQKDSEYIVCYRNANETMKRSYLYQVSLVSQSQGYLARTVCATAQERDGYLSSLHSMVKNSSVGGHLEVDCQANKVQ